MLLLLDDSFRVFNYLMYSLSYMYLLAMSRYMSYLHNFLLLSLHSSGLLFRLLMSIT